MGKRSRFAVASTLASALLACGETRAPHAAETAPAPGPFAIHEWGLIAIDVNGSHQANAATSVAASPMLGGGGGLGLGHHGFGASAGKPVIYVHLDPGTDEARFDVTLRVPSADLLERWPIGGALATRDAETMAGWRNVVARRGACAAETPAPTAGSPICAAPSDHFCEAAELPRYSGDRAACLGVADATSEVLFYRTVPRPSPALPLRLRRDDEGFTVERVGDATIEGPVFLIRRQTLDAPVSIERIGAGDFGRLRAPTQNGLTPNDVRIALTEEAMRRGLTQKEAEAFVDAWAPAYFDFCRRTGPEAAGRAPPALAQVGTSLLHFAPASAIDSMLPLSTSPPARETHRVFLVRWVDGASVLRAPGGLGDLGTIGHGGGTGSAYVPCREGRCPRLRFDGEPTVAGGLQPAVVRRVMQRHANVLRYCYERRLLANPDLQGTVTVDVVIGRNGLVSATRVADTTIDDTEAEQCMTNAVRRMTFPTPEPAGNVRVRQRLAFSITP